MPHELTEQPSDPVHDILFERRGAAGIVTLNRPQALNAVTFGMVRALSRQLTEWESNPAVTRVVVTAAGERAFSAGGDLRALYDLGRAGNHEAALDFWRAEYRLNAAIKHYRKPYVALIDGVVMGGGAGISIHGSHRVAGDRFQFAMPEVGIGFFPDVGATWFLSRMPGQLGVYCALSGARLDPSDAIRAGIASHRVASQRLVELTDALCGNTPVDAILAAFAEPNGEGPLAARQAVIDRTFDAVDIEDILRRLDTEAAGASVDADFVRRTADSIRSKSPTSLKVALGQLQRGRRLDFAECMRLEFRIVSRLVQGHDLYEGIRAVIIDKDQNPHWRPATFEAVGTAAVARHFEALEHELILP
jgi:enoyl-CoA hydratase